MHKKHRTFVAINLPSDVRKVLVGYQKKYADIPAKWVPADNLHVTLVFLGDLTDQELGEVCVLAKETVKNHNSFTVTLNKIGYGPEDKIPPRYIWVGGEMLKEMSLLKKDLEEAFLEKVNFKPEARAFSPHITLARIKEWEWRAIEPEERPEISENLDLVFTVESIEVMESELTRLGPRYTTIESYPLS